MLFIPFKIFQFQKLFERILAQKITETAYFVVYSQGKI